jgi:hypothetical protein
MKNNKTYHVRTKKHKLIELENKYKNETEKNKIELEKNKMNSPYFKMFLTYKYIDTLS